MQIVLAVRKIISASGRLGVLVAAIGLLATLAGAQSIDVATPSPVRTNEVSGTIVARDLGDPRLTDHFYAFTGTPGDVLITVESNNLNGDVDVFTATGLRPLLKFTVYAGGSSAMTKSIYLRKQQDLLLRVEARTPNDDDGTYRLRFGGSFAPITGGPLVAESETPSTQPSAPGSRGAKKGRRVSSVGARIAEPPPAEVAAAPTPEPTPLESPQPAEAKQPTARAGSSNSRTRRPPRRRGRAPQPEKREEPPATTAEERSTAEGSEAEPKTTPARKRPSSRSARARDIAKQPAATGPEDSGPRLIIETTDGTLVNRFMTSVRRVTVENGQVVVVGKDGKIQRIQLASVVRMSIAP